MHRADPCVAAALSSFVVAIAGAVLLIFVLGTLEVYRRHLPRQHFRGGDAVFCSGLGNDLALM